MFAYDFNRLDSFFATLLQRNIPSDAWDWLASQRTLVRDKNDIGKFNITFVSMPRKTGKNIIECSSVELAELISIRKGMTAEGWTSDRLARVWWLMQVAPEKQDTYVARIENLFLSAEMSELVALYSSLPVLAFPESWRKRCAEGIRSNIGQVLEAVICRNPYPSEQLDVAAWNQLVLKALFTEKPVLEIVGLRERRNRDLALSLSDYAHERWAAHREVNPLLWICLAPFIDDQLFKDIERLLGQGNVLEREAAALVCHESPVEAAKKLLAQYPDMRNAIENGSISWEDIACRGASAS